MDQTLSSRPLPHDIDSEQEFDRKVLALCTELGVEDTSPPIQLGHLLLIVILENKDLVPCTMARAMRIMKEHPGLLSQLQDAWKSKKFGEIRRLPFLQAQHTISSSYQYRVPMMVPDYIRTAWERPYQGNAHKVLYDTICEMRAPRYQNIFAIIQSSGYGKTRMLDEHAKLVFTFPFVVRDSSLLESRFAYPYADEHVHEFLTTFGDTEEEAMAGYFKFFTHLFTSTLSIIAESDHRPQSLPEWWRSYLTIPGNRQKLYSQAINFAKSITSQERVLGAVEDLLDVIPTPVSNKQAVKTVIYFDEADELSKHYVGPEQKNRLEILYSCLDAFSRRPIVFIFTSTTSSIHRLAFPKAMVSSSQRAVGNYFDYAPITELPFDCHHSFPLKPDSYSFEDICKLKFLANFGRPLFWSLLESGGSDNDALGLAMDKLAPAVFRRVYQSSGLLNTSPTYSLAAIIDLLLMLDYNPDHQTAQVLQKELIANHMRTCISIQSASDRRYIRSNRSCYPSEPFLAEAAMAKLAKILDPEPGFTHPDVVIDAVNAHFSENLLHSGDRGKLATRMLLLDTYMRACKRGSSGEKVIYSNGCKLKDFLQYLFHQSDQVLKANPDNVPDGPTLVDAFEDAVVRFTHFGKFIDSIATSQDAAHAAFLRCMAIICHDTRKSVDIVIPVLSTRNGVVCRHVMTSILIQVRRGAHPSNPSLFAIDESKVGFFPKNTICKCGRQQRNTELNLPYITFALDLDVRTCATLIPTSTPQITSSKHNRYAIYARGLSTYRSVRPDNLMKYEWLLCSSDVLGDHPHQTPLQLSMVRALKPFWASGEAFSWIQNEALTGLPAQKWDDTLEVGKYSDEHDILGAC